MKQESLCLHFVIIYEGLLFSRKFHLKAETKSVVYYYFFFFLSFYHSYFHFVVVSCCCSYLEDVLHFWTFSPLISDDYTLHGPVFIQEPNHVMFPLNSEEKKVKLNCEVKGNPKPHIRFVNLNHVFPCISFPLKSTST